MATIEELQQQVAALSAQVAAITAPPTDYYTSQYDGEEIDTAIGRALPGGAIDQLRPNPNLLDNLDFRNPVNQRGASGTISTAGYFIDRWKLISGTVTITANGLILNGTMRQIRETAVGATTTASVEMYSGAATITYNDTTKYCDIVSSGGTIARCKLELGSVSTLANDPPADYGEELRRCQRYAIDLHGPTKYGVLGSGVAKRNGTDLASIFCPLPVSMRVTPVATFGGSLTLTSDANAGLGHVVTAVNVDHINSNGITLNVDTAGLTIGTVYQLWRSGDASAHILLSADL